MNSRIWRVLTGRVAALALPVCLATCVAGTDSAGTSGSFTLATAASQLFLVQGGTVQTQVNLTRTGGYTVPVTLTITGAPTGVTATFSQPTLSGATASTTLTLTAALDAPAFAGGISILGQGPDSTGAFTFLPLTVVRPGVSVVKNGTGSGTVTSNPAGINCGSACSTSYQAGTNVTLTATPAAGSTFGGWSSNNNVCTGPSTTCSFTAAQASSSLTATFNSTAQSFSFDVTPSTATVAQGGSSTATANITRVNGYAGAVSLAIAGAPSGLTVTPNPASITGNTATLNIAATTGVAVGNYPVTISATGAGITGTQTTPLNVQVTSAAGGSGNLGLSFATCDPSEVPVWLAVQNGTGAWTQVTVGPNSTFTFDPGAVGGVAFVTPNGAGSSTSVLYATRAEFTTIALGSQCAGLHTSTGTKRLTGNIRDVVANGTVTVTIGGALTGVTAPGPSFALDGVAAGRRDLVAQVATTNANGTSAFPKILLRRNVNYASTVPDLDFNGPDAVFTQFAAVGTNNRGSDVTQATMSFVTANGSSAEYGSTLGGPNAVGYAGVPDSLLQPSELHEIFIFAAPATGSSFRFAALSRHSVGQDSVTFGPAFGQPTITSVGASPYLRLRAQFASQPEYNAVADAEFSQSANSVEVTMTAAYANGTPASWTLQIPDLTAAGYDASWGLKSGTSVDWEVTALSGNFLPLLGATPSDGDRVLGAGAGSTSAAFSRFRAFRPRKH